MCVVPTVIYPLVYLNACDIKERIQYSYVNDAVQFLVGLDVFLPAATHPCCYTAEAVI